MWTEDAAKREALEKIAKLVNDAQSIIWEAENLADEHGLEFDMCLGDYGMGGTYYSEKYVEEQGSRYTAVGWNASSQSC
jgi:hypothetical protein